MIAAASKRVNLGYDYEYLLGVNGKRIAVLVIVAAMGAEAAADGYLLLDDFSHPRPAAGIEWEGFTDRVMGGVSEMSSGIVREEGIPLLRMSGTVSLENRGGFIQVRLKLASRPSVFDASGYRGVRLTLRGEGGEGYYLFARTRSTRLPWKYFSAPLPVADKWRTVEIPWSAFSGGKYGRTGAFRPGDLLSLALTAAFREFTPLLEVREIGLY